MTEKLTVVEALAAVMDAVRGVGKDGFHDAPGAKFKFRGIDAVVNAVGPALRTHRVVVVPQLVSIEHRDVLTSGGKNARETCVVVKYVWTGPDGSTLDTVVPGEAMDNGDKGTAKAMSVAFRIALLQALCLPTDDTDPDTASYERAAPEPRQEQSAPSQNPALTALLAACTENGWDRRIVADRYHDQYGEDVRSVQSVPRVKAFVKLLLDRPAGELAGATNGVVS